MQIGIGGGCRKEKLGGGYVTVVIRGDVAAVNAAVEAAKPRVEGLGKLIACHVIALTMCRCVVVAPQEVTLSLAAGCQTRLLRVSFATPVCPEL